MKTAGTKSGPEKFWETDLLSGGHREISMLSDIFTGLFKCLWILGAAILGVLYILSPIDVIPDVIPIFGWFDDLGVAGWLIKTIIFSPYRHIAVWVIIIPAGALLLLALFSSVIYPLPNWCLAAFVSPLVVFGFWKIGHEID